MICYMLSSHTLAASLVAYLLKPQGPSKVLVLKDMTFTMKLSKFISSEKI